MLPEEVAEMIKNDFQLFSSIALFNPELLNETPWLVLSVQEIELVLQLFLNERVRNNFRHWEGLFATLLEKGVDVRDDFAKEVFSKTDKATEILLNFINKDPKRNVSYVFRGLLGENTDKVLIWLGNTKILTDNVAYAIINAVNEQSSVVINRGAKIWKSSLGLQFCNIDAKVPAYLFALSFNWLTDLDALELMRVAFYPLHTLQAKKKLDYIQMKEVKSKSTPIEPQKPTAIGYVPIHYVEKSKSVQSNFFRFLSTLLDNYYGSKSQEVLNRLLDEYRLGATRDDAVIFWQIDKNGKVPNSFHMVFKWLLVNG